MENKNDSLKRSHSVYSNSKLTFLCIISSIMLTILVVSISYYFKVNNNLFLYVGIASFVLTVFNVFLFSRFKR